MDVLGQRLETGNLAGLIGSLPRHAHAARYLVLFISALWCAFGLVFLTIIPSGEFMAGSSRPEGCPCPGTLLPMSRVCIGGGGGGGAQLRCLLWEAGGVLMRWAAKKQKTCTLFFWRPASFSGE